MQPYFLPYIGYWQLINAVDTFVVYDNIQFSKSGWFHRNNILVNGTRTLFTIPLKKDSDYLDVRDRKLSDSSNIEINKIISRIKNNYKKAPYFNDAFPLIQDILLFSEKNLFEYILNSITKICSYLEIKTPILKSSDVHIDHSLRSQNKVIAISKALKADIYINPIGGVSLYDRNTFKNYKVELLFLKAEMIEYSQFCSTFEPSLSIVDVMMFNNVATIQKMLTRFKLDGEHHV